MEGQLAEHEAPAHSDAGQRNVHIPPRVKGLLVEGSSKDNVTHCEPDRNVARMVFGPAFCFADLSISRKNAQGPSALIRTGGGGGIGGPGAEVGADTVWFPALADPPCVEAAAVAAGDAGG